MTYFFKYFEMETINDRVLTLANKLCTTQKHFAEMIGISIGTLNNITNGRKSKPSFDILEKILTCFHQVDANWLITGKGQMLKGSGTEPHKHVSNCDACAYKQEMIDIQKERILTLQELCSSKDQLVTELRRQLNHPNGKASCM
jgi:transcriptional regulator with XRE-family HTH domain